MHITRFQVEKWVEVLRIRGMSGHLDAKDVIEVLENDVGAGITPVTLPLSPIPANLDDDALADALAEDMAMALNEDAAGAVWDTRVVDLPGPITEGPEVDAAVRAWMIEVLGMVAGLQPQATIPLRQPIDSLERLILGRPRGSAPR